MLVTQAHPTTAGRRSTTASYARGYTTAWRGAPRRATTSRSRRGRSHQPTGRSSKWPPDRLQQPRRSTPTPSAPRRWSICLARCSNGPPPASQPQAPTAHTKSRRTFRLVHADLFDLPFREHGFATVMGLGLTHLFDDLEPLVSALCKQLAPGGELYLAGLVAQTRRGRRYLALLERAGEVARPRTAKELHTALGRPSTFWTAGCMAYARIPNPVTPSAHPV